MAAIGYLRAMAELELILDWGGLPDAINSSLSVAANRNTVRSFTSGSSRASIVPPIRSLARDPPRMCFIHFSMA
jgi:hypothetical protein